MKAIYLILILAVVSCSEPCNCPTYTNVYLDHESRVSVVYVTDGDTYKFETQGETVIIRLLGVDTYESRHGTRLDGQAAKAGISSDSAYNIGVAAKQYATDQLLNKSVVLLRDSTQANIDTYGRLLRHVKLNDSMFADMLRVRGYAVPE